MSRLDSAIRRLQAQKAGLEWAATAIAGQPGPVLEIGLGNGRTYDHLRGLLPDRAVFVFDRQVTVHPACRPPDDRLFLGDLAVTLPRAAAHLGPVAALVHADLGSGRPDCDATTTATLLAAMPGLLAPGGLLLSDQDLAVADRDGSRRRAAGLAVAPLPDAVPAGRYFAYRRAR